MKEATEAPSEAGPKTTTIVYIIASIILLLIFMSSIIICICIIQRLRKKNNTEIKSNNLYNTDGEKPARTEPVITAEQWKSFFLPLIFTTELGSLDRCVVCLDLFTHNETSVTQILICEHYFHLECIKLWLGKEEKCPICKTKLGMWD
jgi:hypothetical protein